MTTHTTIGRKRVLCTKEMKDLLHGFVTTQARYAKAGKEPRYSINLKIKIAKFAINNRHRFKQAHIAEWLDVTPSSISRWVTDYQMNKKTGLLKRGCSLQRC